MRKNHPDKQLVTKINDAHRSAVEAAQSALVSAREAGRLLLEAKEALPHGQWSGWLQEHVEFSDRTARGYMRVASRWEELENGNGVADLSLRGALALLSQPREQEDGAADPFAPGEPPAYLPEPGYIATATTSGPAGTSLRAWIAPSKDHPGYPLCAPDAAAYYITVRVDLPNGQGHLEGGVKPWRAGYVERILADDGFPLDATWEHVEGEPWTYNHLLFESHEDYVERWVLGRTLPNMERVIREGADEYNAVRVALKEIRDRRLYRETHESFEAYVADSYPDLSEYLELLDVEVAS